MRMITSLFNAFTHFPMSLFTRARIFPRTENIARVSTSSDKQYMVTLHPFLKWDKAYGVALIQDCQSSQIVSTF